MGTSSAVRVNSQEPGIGRVVIKICPSCGTEFTLPQLLEDPEVVPLGMQFSDEALTNNFYYFNHERPGCGSTFVVPVLAFLPFIAEPVPDAILTGTEVCGHHCLSLEDLAVCNAACRYAPFRRFLVGMRKRSVA